MRNMKKVLALVLVVAMVFSLGITASASEDMSGQIVIMHTNDVHGAVTGYAKIAALKAEYEAMGAEVILVSAGDFIQGTVYVNVSMGETAVTLMNATGYDFVVPGNHEFDYGYANLVDIMEEAEFSVITANIDYAYDEFAFDDYDVYETADGTLIGFFGLTTAETQTKAHPSKIEGLEFAAGSDMNAIAQEQVDILTEMGCDVIVCLAHLGTDDSSAPNRSVDVLAEVTGIDYMIDGHSHTVIEGEDNDYESGNTFLTSTGSSFANVGIIVLDSDGSYVSSELIEITDDMAEDAEVKAIADEIIAELDAIYDEVFASTEVVLDNTMARLEQTNLGLLICDAMIWKLETLGTTVDAAVTNGGGIRTTLQVGDITMADINTVLPFGNTVCLVTLTGAELLEALEASTFSTPESIAAFPQETGIVFTLDTTVEWVAGEQYTGSTYYGPAEVGTRITIESVGGQEFSLDGTYVIATNDYLAAGGDTYFVFANSSTTYDLGYSLDEVVIEYIQTELNGVVTAEMYSVGSSDMTILTEADIVEEEEEVVLTAAEAFSDVDAAEWYYEAVSFAYEEGLFIGMGDGTYGTASEMTVTQYLTVLYRFAVSAGIELDDCDTTTTEAAEYMYELIGFEADLDASVTREEMAAFAMAVVDLAGDAVSFNDRAEPPTFTDLDEVSEEFVEAISEFYVIGGISGYEDGTFQPEGTATRAEVSQVFYNIYSNIEFAA